MPRFSFVLGLLGVGFSGAASAQATDFPITYVKVEGNASTVYLTNVTGTQTKKLYTTPSKANITSIDLNPQGGEVAFIERRSGVPWAIKILKFDANGVPALAARTLAGPCYPDSLDYHPSGTSLIYSDVCAQVMNISTINTDGTGKQVLQESPSAGGWYLTSPRWLKNGLSYVYTRSIDPNVMVVCLNSCDSAAGEQLWSGTQVNRMDVGRVNDWVLFDGPTSFVNKVDVATREVSSNILKGTGAHYSPDDSRILYVTPHAASGDYLQILNADGSTTRVGTKGTFGGVDWRP